mmetsp:Transcript_26549/g.39416  ORF Transcript_26549/g.39416 Transcript_26549/m.39416 type:complete len:102 (-) Transcript_26549:234-539(-)
MDVDTSIETCVEDRGCKSFNLYVIVVFNPHSISSSSVELMSAASQSRVQKSAVLVQSNALVSVLGRTTDEARGFDKQHCFQWHTSIQMGNTRRKNSHQRSS